MNKFFLLLFISIIFALGANASVTVCGNSPDENGNYSSPYITRGTITWDATSHTLTLDNAVIEYNSGNPYDFFYPIEITEDATILINGECKILTDGFVALSLQSYNAKDVTITGNGTLITSSTWKDIFVRTTHLTIKNINLETTEGIGDNGDGVLCTLTFDNVQAKINGFIERIGEGITFKNCAITYPEDAYIARTYYGYCIYCGNDDIPDYIIITRNGSVAGDVNGDGDVTGSDVTALYNYLLFNDSSAIVNGDQNSDGNITGSDVTAVYNILLGL